LQTTYPLVWISQVARVDHDIVDDASEEPPDAAAPVTPTTMVGGHQASSSSPGAKVKLEFPLYSGNVNRTLYPDEAETQQVFPDRYSNDIATIGIFIGHIYDSELVSSVGGLVLRRAILFYAFHPEELERYDIVHTFWI
jgi:hypothetical protein